MDDRELPKLPKTRDEMIGTCSHLQRVVRYCDTRGATAMQGPAL